MSIAPLEVNSLGELEKLCDWEYGQICCVKFDYQALMAELPVNSEPCCYRLSPETVKFVIEGLQLLEERLPWRWDGQRRPNDTQWLEISDKIELSQLEMSKPEPCMPVGMITPFGGSAAPDGWLICDGRAIDRSQYQNLYSVIGTIYGLGDGESTFNLPDLRGKVAVGLDNSTEFGSLGQVGGEKSHLVTLAEMPTHHHTETGSTTIPMNGGLEAPVITSMSSPSITGDTGGNEAHNNLQPYQVVNFIIKY